MKSPAICSVARRRQMASGPAVARYADRQSGAGVDEPSDAGQRGYYGGQNAGVSVVKAALAEGAKRRAEGQPKIEVKVPVAVNQPYVPPTIEKAVKQTNGWGGSGVERVLACPTTSATMHRRLDDMVEDVGELKTDLSSAQKDVVDAKVITDEVKA